MSLKLSHSIPSLNVRQGFVYFENLLTVGDGKQCKRRVNRNKVAEIEELGVVIM